MSFPGIDVRSFDNASLAYYFEAEKLDLAERSGLIGSAVRIAAIVQQLRALDNRSREHTIAAIEALVAKAAASMPKGSAQRAHSPAEQASSASELYQHLGTGTLSGNESKVGSIRS